MTSLRESLTRLSERELLEHFERLVVRDRRTTVELLVAIAEVDTRKIWAKHACSSMFTFCLKRFHMSEQVTAKRLRAARIARRYPVVLEMVARGELHLSAIQRLSRHLTQENHVQLLERAKHKSSRAVERLIAEHAPRPDVPSRIRALPRTPASAARPTAETYDRSRERPPQNDAARSHGAQNDAPRIDEAQNDRARIDATRNDAAHNDAPHDPARAHSIPIQAAAAPPTTATSPDGRTAAARPDIAGARPDIAAARPDIEAARPDIAAARPDIAAARPDIAAARPDIEAGARPGERRRPGAPPSRPATPAIVPLSPRRYKIEITVDEATHDKLRSLQDLLGRSETGRDPAAILTRAIDVLLAETLKRKAAQTDRPRPPTNARARDTAAKSDQRRPRGIPAAVRRKVWSRDCGRCRYVDAQGRRCNETRSVEFHHRVAFARGGPHAPDNIELRCPAHNQYQADLDFGRSFMDSKRNLPAGTRTFPGECSVTDDNRDIPAVTDDNRDIPAVTDDNRDIPAVTDDNRDIPADANAERDPLPT